MLEVKGLSVSYGQHRALHDIALQVAPGETVVILGANGAGKSSLLKALAGISEGKVSGSVTLMGTELLGQAPDRIVESGIALVPEGRGVFGDLTVAENLALGAYAMRARDEQAASRERVLRLFPKLHERRDQVVRTMSGGEQQMVAIGRAMMSNPDYLALDEPSLGLSPLLCRDLFQSLDAVRRAGIGILLVEQNARQSLAIADRAYLLENGAIVHEGRAAALRDDPAVQAAYLGGAAAASAPGAAAGSPRPLAQPHAAPAAAAAARDRDPRPPAGQAQALAPAAAMPTAPRATTGAARDASAAARPPGDSPDAIAAAALAALTAQTSRPATPDDRLATPRPPSPSTSPTLPARPPSREPWHPASPEQPRPAVPAAARPVTEGRQASAAATDALLGGLSIADLVARAAETSRARAAPDGAAAAPRPNPRPAPRTTSTPLPPAPALTLGGGESRLKSVLSEIEAAALNARMRRSDPHRQPGDRHDA